MKISCIPVCFFEDIIITKKMSLTEWIGMAADIGLDGIEVYRHYPAVADRGALEQVAREIRRAGLEVSMFTSYGELATSSEEERLTHIKSLRRDVDAAVELGTSIVRVTAGSWPKDCVREEALDSVADCLRRSLDYAEQHGVMLALEDHPEIGASIDDFTNILNLVDDERLKVNLDRSNPMEAGDSPARLAELVKDRVVHVHASDRNQQLELQVIGEGCVPFSEVFGALRSVGYDGWISLEAGGSKGRPGIVQGMRTVRRAWQG